MEPILNENENKNEQQLTEALEKKGFRAWLSTTKGKVIMITLSVLICFSLGISSFFFFGGTAFFSSLKDDSVKPPVKDNAPLTEATETDSDEAFTEEIVPAVEDDEMRGVYIASVNNINFPSKAGLSEDQLKKELDATVATARLAGIDTLFFQVRPTGDALYPSEVFPSSRYLMGIEGEPMTFDPLQYLIDEALRFEMKVVAWVNPYRITNTKADDKEAALATLSENNPAKMNPDLTVFYDGKLYYNPALSEVQDLITSGVEEICRNYEVAGVLYDDYFYPYKVQGEEFDDSDAYSVYEGNLSLEDWRRENVNRMVKASFDTVKGVSSELTFGVSPFGIWKNAGSDPKGSDTKGMEAYHEIFCDALAWIEGGYVDYVAPQIYWERGNKAADFSTLTRWWSAQVDGTGVKLYISHAVYKVPDFKLGADEIIQQITYSRAYMGVGGNILYGFADIKNNTSGILDALRDFYATPYLEDVHETGVTGIRFARPQNGLKTNTNAQFVSAASDPRYPVYSDYGKVGRTKSGFFSILMPLVDGNNVLNLSQNGKNYSLKVIKTTSSTSAKPKTLSSFQIAEFSPADKDGVYLSSGESMPLSLTAPAGAKVTATVGGKTVTLNPTLKQSGSSAYLKEVYTASYTPDPTPHGEALVPMGKIIFRCEKNGKALTVEGPEVFIIPLTYSVLARVKDDYTHLKTAPDSSFYDDYTPASVGMTDRLVSAYGGVCKLAFGGYIEREHAELIVGQSLPEAKLDSVDSYANETETVFALSLGGNPPLDYKVEKTRITVTLHSCECVLDGEIEIPKGDFLFYSVQAESGGDGTTVLTFVLDSVKNYYGFDFSYEDSALLLKFRQPQKLAEGEKPLLGKTVILDAGHGGTDAGAPGFVSGNDEKDLNLKIVLKLAEKMEKLGANVVLSRNDDTTVSLYERMDLITATDPDLSISVHHNSAVETKDANTTRGTWGLYWSPAGISLTDAVRISTAKALGYYDYGTKSQMLALCRNHRMPQTLIEVGFICSPAEYQMAMRSDYDDVVSDAIVEGVLDWYRMQEKVLEGKG